MKTEYINRFQREYAGGLEFANTPTSTKTAEKILINHIGKHVVDFGSCLWGDIVDAMDEYATQFKAIKEIPIRDGNSFPGPKIINSEQTQPVSIGEEVKVKACEFLDSMRAYERESGNSIFYDERTSEELWNIHIGKLDADLNPVEQTQPVPSKEVQENQTYGEFMRSNPEISTPSTTDTQDGKLNETFHNYGYPTDGGILGTEVSVKIDNQSNEETPSTTDIEKEAEQLYPYWTNELVEETLYNSHQEVKREAHIKAYQMHRNDGLDQLIEWMEWESHRRWNESHELPDFTEILTKANEIKESLNK